MSDVWAPPQAEVRDVGISGNPNAPEIRRQHLNHEANIRAVGLLYYLSAFLILLAAVGMLVAIALGGASHDKMGTGFAVGVGIAALLFSGFYWWVGRGLRTLNPTSRIVGGVLTAFGLLGFPIGTLISAYILYLLFSRKGAMVFSDEYKQIVADTPDIKYRTSIVVWILLALLLVPVVAGIVAALSDHST